MKIEIRTHCKICGAKITKKRFRIYCSPRCMHRFHNQKHYQQQKEWQKKNRQKLLLSSGKDLVQCLICGKWFIQVGSHIAQTHGITCREYRELFRLEVKRGVVPPWFRKLKGDIALANKTFKNLEAGKKWWFKKGDRSIGRYERSPITLERLKTLYKFNL